MKKGFITPKGLISLLILLLLLLCGVAKNEAKPMSQIRNIRMGEHGAFSRLVFYTNSRISYTVSQDDKGLIVNFHPATISPSIFYNKLSNSLIKGVSVSTQNNQVNIHVNLDKSPSACRHFTLEKGCKVVLDICRKENRPTSKEGRILDSNVNIRKGPNPNSPTIGRADVNEIFEIISFQDGWYKVSLDERKFGYIFKNYLSPVNFDVAPEQETSSPLEVKEAPSTEPSHTKGTGSKPRVIDSQFHESENPEARRIYESGLTAFKQGKFKEAVLFFRQLIGAFPKSSFNEAALYLIGDCYFNLEPSEYFQSTLQAYQRAISAYPKSEKIPRAYLHLALSLLNKGYHPEAMAYLGLIGKDYPDSPYAPQSYLCKGKHLYEKGMFEAAREEFQKIVDDYGDSPEGKQASAYRAKCLFKMGWFEQAEVALTNLQEKWPDSYQQDSEFLYCLAENLFQLKSYQKARNYLFRVLNLFPQVDADHTILARIGDSYYNQGRKKEAIKIYRITENLYPGSEGAAIAQLRLLEENMGDDEAKQNKVLCADRKDARALYTEISNRDPKSPLAELAMYKIATSFYEKKDYMPCISTLKEMIAKYPNSALLENVTHTLGEAWLELIKLYYAQGRYLSILDFYSRNQECLSKITNGECFLHLGNQFEQVALYDQAIELYQRADDLLWPPDKREECLFSLGKTYFKNRSYAQARYKLEHLLEKYPHCTYAEDARLYLGKCAYYAGDYERATQVFKQILKGSPSKATQGEALYLLGMSLEGLGKFSEAAKALVQVGQAYRVLERVQDIFGVYYKLGDVLLKDGDYLSAVAAYKTALETDRRNEKSASLLYNLGKCYLALNKEQEARWTFGQALEISQDDFWKEISNTMLIQMELDHKVSGLLPGISHGSL